SFSSTPRQEPAPSNTRQQPSAASPRKESTLETPYRLVATVAAPRRDSRGVPAATAAGRRGCRDARQPAAPLPPAPGTRGWFLRRPPPAAVPAGTNGSQRHLCRLPPVCWRVRAGAVSAEVTSLFLARPSQFEGLTGAKPFRI